MTTYENDVAAWALEQAGFIRAGRFDLVDIENIAEEIEDVNAWYRIELEHHMAELLAPLIKWQYHPELRGDNGSGFIEALRKIVLRKFKKTPSLKSKLADPEWIEGIWSDAIIEVIKESDLYEFPEDCPWSMEDVLTSGWLPK